MNKLFASHSPACVSVSLSKTGIIKSKPPYRVTGRMKWEVNTQAGSGYQAAAHFSAKKMAQGDRTTCLRLQRMGRGQLGALILKLKL